LEDPIDKGATVKAEAVPSDLGGPANQAKRGDGGALMRMYSAMSDADQQELLRYAVELARKPKD